MNLEEENNYPKAFAATGIILGLMIALCYFIVFITPPVQDMGTGGILVNYGTTDEGMGKDITSTDEPSVSPKANHTQPTKVTRDQPTDQPTKVATSNQKVVTQDAEDAPEVAANAKKSSAAVATEPAKPVKKQVVNTAALYKGPSKTGSGSGDGTTTTAGNQGSKNGSTLSSNYGPGGSGNGLNMPNWTFETEPNPENFRNVPGVVVVDFVVDEHGAVISAGINRKKTRADLSLVESCVTAIKNTKFVSLTSNTGSQKGEYTFRFRVR